MTGADAAARQDHPESVYQELLNTGVLAYQRCTACHQATFPPRVLCPRCGETDLRWEECDGGGTVYSTTTLAPRDGVPYSVALIDVDEGFRMMTNVVDVAPDDVTIGMRVRVQISTVDGVALPLFHPEGKDV